MSDGKRVAVETTIYPDVRRTWKFASMTADADDEMPPGPWDDEPDKIQWVDRATDLDCLMLRNYLGGWCGYVGVPQSHRLHGVDYSTDAMPDIDVHGGLTFADRCAPGEPIDGVCHIAAPGRERSPWWFGFDCAHLGDAQPFDFYMELTRGGPFTPVRGTYRAEQYVQYEVGELAAQLAAVR